MSKVLKWALASGEMALFVCHSAEHYFTEKTFLSKFADEEKRDKKKMEFGFWKSLMGAHNALAIVALWHWHLDLVVEGVERVKSLLFFSCLLTDKPFLPLLTILRDSSHWTFLNMNMHDKSAFFSALWAVFFFSIQRPVVLCLIGPDIWKGPWIKKKKKVVYDNWRTLLAAE